MAIDAARGSPAMINYLVTQTHAYTMAWFLEAWGKALSDRIRIVTYESLFAGKRLPRDDSTFIFSDLDRLRSQARAVIGQFHDALVATHGPARVLNDPVRSLLRFDLLRILHDRGINRFGGFRASDRVDPTRFPLFVRDERGNVSKPPPLLRTEAAYAAAVRDLEAQDVPREHIIAIEFRDTADSSGIYRKYGAFVAGERIIPRHLFFSRGWLVKEADLDEPALLAEELAFIEANPHAQTLREVFRLAGISYGRVDYSLLDGQPQIWEINTNPILTTPKDKISQRRAVHRRFVERIAAAFVAIDSGAT